MWLDLAELKFNKFSNANVAIGYRQLLNVYNFEFFDSPCQSDSIEKWMDLHRLSIAIHPKWMTIHPIHSGFGGRDYPSLMELHPIVNGWNSIQMVGIPFKMDGTPSNCKWMELHPNGWNSIQNGWDSIQKWIEFQPIANGWKSVQMARIPTRQSGATLHSIANFTVYYGAIGEKWNGLHSSGMEYIPFFANCTMVQGLTTFVVLI